MTLDTFRPHLKWIYRPFVDISIKIGITPNIFTVASFFVALLAGIAFYFGDVIFGTFFIMCNAAFDSMDGAVARAMNIQSRKGDFLDHVVDRYADIFIITGIFAGGFAPWPIGVFALTGVLMVSYIGTQAQAVGVGRFYLFPLAAAGQAGVERSLELMRAEIERGMKLMGCSSIAQLSRANLRFR